MNKNWIALCLLAAALPATAIAGFKVSEQVSIVTLSSSSMRVRGSLIGAHNSSDGLQYIGCQNRYDFSYCWARDASGRTAMCSASEPGRVAAMRSVNAASYIDITMTNGTCANIEISTSSKWMSPVAPPMQVGQ
ncbi:MAG: hypothetical protein M4D80_20630 [Myxococcota bacterium]|nr:hypothetical protein [Deltaproteobacteria bacterium]MDQ3337575.1 hypothetical protein [Myxococcota bacterium]